MLVTSRWNPVHVGVLREWLVCSRNPRMLTVEELVHGKRVI